MAKVKVFSYRNEKTKKRPNRHSKSSTGINKYGNGKKKKYRGQGR